MSGRNRVSKSIRRYTLTVFAAIAATSVFHGQAMAQVDAQTSAKMIKPAEGLEATLWASEPMVKNPTTMDIDSRGRVWVTEGLNYRLHRNGARKMERVPDADAIKILEDTDGDGKADKVTVFADKIFPIPRGLPSKNATTNPANTLAVKFMLATAPTCSCLRIRTAMTRPISVTLS